MSKLGKIERIDDLRTIWPHEANDFSKWLAQEENLALLSEAVGIDIVLEERESAVGGFSVDIFASEEGTGRKIIIENQLEETNHDHLGKIITYASGKEAQVIIWIVKRARDEHKKQWNGSISTQMKILVSSFLKSNSGKSMILCPRRNSMWWNVRMIGLRL